MTTGFRADPDGSSSGMTTEFEAEPSGKVRVVGWEYSEYTQSRYRSYITGSLMWNCESAMTLTWNG